MQHTVDSTIELKLFVGAPEPAIGRDPTILATGAKALDDADGCGKAEALKISGTAEALPLMPARVVVDTEAEVRLSRSGRAGMGGSGSSKALLKLADGDANKDVAGAAVGPVTVGRLAGSVTMGSPMVGIAVEGVGMYAIDAEIVGTDVSIAVSVGIAAASA